MSQTREFFRCRRSAQNGVAVRVAAKTRNDGRVTQLKNEECHLLAWGWVRHGRYLRKGESLEIPQELEGEEEESGFF